MDQLRPWLPRVVFDRLASGQGEFLTELRPAVALFLRFASLDYDDDPQAHTKLAAYIRWVQQTVVHSDGALLDVTVGDKGSYLYAAWGAPTMHEDDTRRAVAVDHALRTPPPEFASVGPVQIGLSRGVMRTGPCGSPTRRNYGVMGDAVNLTARLMEAASPGQVLASEPIATATITEFVWTPLPAIQVKGKREPVAVYDLGVGRARETIRLHEPRYPGPLLGRSAEQAQIAERLLRAAQGHGQIIGISGEAGLGKSRLVTEVVQQCQEQGWRVYGGAAEAYRRHTPYLAWTPIWRGLFGLPTSLAGNATAQASRIVTLVAEQRLLFRSGCRCWGPCWTWRSRRRP